MEEGTEVVMIELLVVPLLSNEDLEFVSVGTELDEAVEVDGGKSVLLADD